MAESKTPSPVIRTVAKFTGFHGTRRVLTKADQDKIAGVDKGVGKEDLVWEPGNSKLDVTDVHPDVLDYIKSDAEFSVRAVEVTPDEPAS